MNEPTVTLDHQRELTLDEVLRVARGAAAVSLSRATRALLAVRRSEVVRFVRESRQPAYGFNRGFGHNVKLSVDHDEQALNQLQLNLIRSHAAGIGEPAPRDVVRATMLLRAHSLARGHSGVRPEVVEQLVAMLDADIVPVVPRHGSVSASGDLCPLSHVALGMIGEGEVDVAGQRRPAADALAQAGLAPLQLQMKEGLALNNGSQYLTAIGVVTADKLRTMLQSAAIATALSTQVMLGSMAPFRAELHALRPHPGAIKIAGWLVALLHHAPIQAVHRDTALDGEVQDPYNLRCAAQILGTCYDLVDEAQRTFTVEANSATDNPLILRAADGTQTDIVSGGHFHGMPVAVKVYNLVQAAAIIARLSNMRCARFVDEQRNKGLGSDLVWPDLDATQRATSSGMMAAELASASLTNWIWGQCMPSHLLSMSTDAGQEDHVSMGAPLALRLLDLLPRLADLLAIELAFCAQAAGIRKAQGVFPSRARVPRSVEQLRDDFAVAMKEALEAEEGRPVEIDVVVNKLYPWTEQDRQLSPPCEAVLGLLQQAFPLVTVDRPLSADLARLAALVRDGELVRTAGAHMSWD